VTANPQTFNRYSYVLNSPLTLIDPTGMLTIDPGSRGSGIPFLSLYRNDEMSEGPDQQAQQQPTEPQVPTSITAEVGDPKPYGNLPLGPNFYFSGMGSLIKFTIRDQQGQPMSNVTTTEAVTPASTVRNTDPVTRADGTFVDLVGRGNFGPQLTNDEARAAARDARNNPNNIVQDHVLFIMSPGGSAIATHSRTFSNVDANGNLRTVVSVNRISNNYTITLTEIKVTQIQPRICLGVIRR